MNPLINPPMDQIELFFTKDGFIIKEPTKVDQPLNKDMEWFMKIEIKVIE